MQGYIDRSMSILQNATQTDAKGTADKELTALSVIQVLSDFLDRFEGKRPIKPELKPMGMQMQQF